TVSDVFSANPADALLRLRHSVGDLADFPQASFLAYDKTVEPPIARSPAEIGEFFQAWVQIAGLNNRSFADAFTVINDQAFAKLIGEDLAGAAFSSGGGAGTSGGDGMNPPRLIHNSALCDSTTKLVGGFATLTLTASC